MSPANRERSHRESLRPSLQPFSGSRSFISPDSRKPTPCTTAPTTRAIRRRFPAIDSRRLMLKRIIVAAALAGLVSGLSLTAIQRLQVTPLIRQAEVLESHVHATAPSLLATTSANVVLATGFALLLGSAFSLRRRTGWRVGLLWGAAGYAVFFLAPALGLPAELPGTESAPLRDRELWWAGTAACSAAGLWLAAFARRPLLRLLGVALLIAPHLIGAPHPAVHGGTATVEMTGDFIRAAYIANALLWLSIGGWFGFFYRGHSAAADS